MFRDVVQTYRTSAGLVRVLPFAALAAIAVEGIQHIVEWQLGMYSGDRVLATAAEAHPLRMGFGYAKTAVLFAICFFVWRQLGQGRVRIDARAAALFLPVLMFNSLMLLGQLAGGNILSSLLEGRGLLLVGLVAMLAAMAFELCFAPWKVASALGNARVDVGASFRIMSGQIGRSFAFNLVVLLPAMMVHYALGIGAVFTPPAVSAGLLAADTLFVGFMAMLLPAIDFAVADRAARRAGIDLAAADAPSAALLTA